MSHWCAFYACFRSTTFRHWDRACSWRSTPSRCPPSTSGCGLRCFTTIFRVSTVALHLISMPSCCREDCGSSDSMPVCCFFLRCAALRALRGSEEVRPGSTKDEHSAPHRPGHRSSNHTGEWVRVWCRLSGDSFVPTARVQAGGAPAC